MSKRLFAGIFFSAFVHRCGRTARVGKKGSALLFLLENESAYVDFIEINQKAPMLVSSCFVREKYFFSKRVLIFTGSLASNVCSKIKTC